MKSTYHTFSNGNCLLDFIRAEIPITLAPPSYKVESFVWILRAKEAFQWHQSVQIMTKGLQFCSVFKCETKMCCVNQVECGKSTIE